MKNYDSLSDDELTALLTTGDAVAYTEIYNRYWQLLYRHARKMLGNGEEAKDVVQDVFSVLWSLRNGPVIKPPLAAFLYSATRNKILNLLKHLKIEAKYQNYLREVLENNTAPPDRLILEKELAAQIEEGIQSLPDKMRKIFELSRKEYKTHKEISEQLNISDKTVKKQVSNALQIIKSKLGAFLLLF